MAPGTPLPPAAAHAAPAAPNTPSALGSPGGASRPHRPTALVTGAARRLGREIALTLARLGWNVAIHHRHSRADALQTAADCSAASSANGPFHGQFHAFFADLGDEASVRQLWANVVAHFGQVDAVVNSASTFEHDDAATFGYAALDTHLRANTGAAIVLAQCLHAHRLGLGTAMATSASAPSDGTPAGAAASAHRAASAASAERPPAVVVNLLDQKLWNPNPDFLSYTLSKAALEAATTLLAQALAPQVRVVGVAPGLTLTSHMLSDEQFQALHKLSPLGRSSTPEDVAATVAFALGNRSITGTTLLVDGGQHLMRFERDFSHMPGAAAASTVATGAHPAAPSRPTAEPGGPQAPRATEAHQAPQAPAPEATP